jgi:NADPH-dependent ferric siderophore reductase
MTVMDRSDPATRVLAHQRAGSGVTRIPYPVGIRRVRVAARHELTPEMLRLTLQGPGFAGFHTYQADDHVKIVFPDADGAQRDPVEREDLTLDWPSPMPTTRKYTIRRFDPQTLECDLDFVLHEGGVASTWARGCRVGDEVSVAGPPGAKAFALTYDHYVLAVDATALPAAARWLEESTRDVSAHVVIETTDAALRDGYPLAERPGVDVQWVGPGPGGSVLAATVQGLALPPGRSFLFAAGEAGDIKPLRGWAAGRMDALINGYWKRGVVEFDE